MWYSYSEFYSLSDLWCRDEVTHPRPEGEEEVEDVQVMLNSNFNPCCIRDLKDLDFICKGSADL